MNFDDFAFDQRISAGIRSCGYETPTPIQVQSMPPILEGRDVMGLAQTGSGKTAAFVLPILQRLIDSGAHPKGPNRVLVLAPTRELALQIHETFVELGKQTGIRSAAVFGGVGVTPQVNALRKATIVVACPGRLIDLMNQGKANMNQVDTLVLDEADRMLDMGFMPDIKRILAKLPRTRQNLLFSATMPNDIRKLSQNILRNPAEVQVDRSAPAASVSHVLYPVPKHLKAGMLYNFLDSTRYQSVLIFTRTKHKARSLGEQLERKGYGATFLQGNLSQSRRQKALDGFRSGDFRIMVATDIAARGIDCASISHVINFDMPDTAETYTHRIGRTGRAGRTGEALSFVTSDDGQMIRDIERVLGKQIKRITVEDFDYNTPKIPQSGNGRGQRPHGRQGQQGRGQQSRGRSGKPSGGKPANRSGKPAGSSSSSSGGNQGNSPNPYQRDDRKGGYAAGGGEQTRPKRARRPRRRP